jgi:hypothetical protein
MTPFKGFFALFSTLGLAAIACSVSVDLGTQPAPTRVSQPSVEQQVGTGVAQALQALTLQAPFATPTPTATPLAANPPVAAILSQPAQLSVSVATNCRAGPGINYGYVITIAPGTVVTLVGQDPADNYWVIEVPGDPGSVCWLWGQYASVTGNTVGLYFPATPVLFHYALSEPRNLRASCTANYASHDHGDGWNHDGHGGGEPPWGHPTPSPTPTPDHDEPPWGGHTPRPTRTPDDREPPWGNLTPRPTRTPDAEQSPSGSESASVTATASDADSADNDGSPSAAGTQADFATPWPTPTPELQSPESGADVQQGNAGAQWVSYGSGRRIDSWTITLRWKNTDGDQTGVRVYKNGHRVATLGKNASSYTDTISRDWEDGITYGVQVFNSYAVSSSVSVDVDRCR